MATVNTTVDERTDIEAYIGADSTINYTFTEGGVAFDFSGYTLKFEILDPETNALIAQWTTGDNVSVASNVVTVTLKLSSLNLKKETYSVRLNVHTGTLQYYWVVGDLRLRHAK